MTPQAHRHSVPEVSPPTVPLPESVTQLVRDVVEQAAGPGPAAAVTSFLQAQCVTSLDDLQYIELAWMREALNDVPLLLLNKLLKVAAQGP